MSRSKPKHPKSATLAAVRERWEQERRTVWTPEARAAFAAITDYPHNFRAAVFCWLWVNHAELSAMLRSPRLRPTWDSVARIMAADGVLGRYGAPPTGNAVRRVWDRVCREIEAERARKAKAAAKEPPRW